MEFKVCSELNLALFRLLAGCKWILADDGVQAPSHI